MFLKLKTLKIKAFRRFVNEQTIDFTNRENLIQIDGLRPETGGSSGSGKSSIPIAVDCLFGVSDIADKSLQSWLTKDTWSVEGVFDAIDNDGTHELIIKRSKKDGLSISLGGIITSGSSKMAEEALDKIIGLPRDLFRRMYHKKQKEGGFFIHLTAGQAYKTMTSVLNLTELTDQVKKIEVKIAQNEKDLATLTFKKTGAESNLTAVKGTLDSLQKPEQPIFKDLTELKLKSDTLLIKKLTLLKEQEDARALIKEPIVITPNDTELKQQITELDSKIAVKVTERVDLLKSKTDKLSQLQAMLDKFNKELGDIALKKREISELEKQNELLWAKIQHIEKASCPTCAQTWANESSASQLNKAKGDKETNEGLLNMLYMAVAKEASINESIQKVKNAQGAVQITEPTSSVDAEIELLRESKTKIQESIKNIINETNQKNIQSRNEHNALVNELSAKYHPLIADITIEINNTNNEITLENSTLQNYEANLSNFNKNSETLTFKVLELAKEVTKVGEDTFALNKKIAIGNEVKRAIKSYTLQIFQDSLDSISEQATRILNTTPNMATASIYFESARELADGKIKEEINAILSVDGEADIPVKSLSGGESTSIEIATDLAFLDMVESRVKIGTDFFFLDEPFNGLDSANSLPIIDLLKSLDTNKKIIVVDHNPEVKEVITDRILVERIGTESTIIDRK